MNIEKFTNFLTWRKNVTLNATISTTTIIVAVILVFIAVLYLCTLSIHWKFTMDSAMYITLGKSIATGQGFKYMGYPHIKYPFFLPLMLSPIILFFGYNFLLMRLLIVSMGVISVFLIYRWFRQSEGCFWAIVLMVLTGLAYPMVVECTRILSDLPYMCLSLLALVFIRKYSTEQRWFSLTACLAVVFILAAYFTRIVGLSLGVGAAASLLFYSGWRKNIALNGKKTLFVGLIFVAAVSGWFFRNYIILTDSDRLTPVLREGVSYERELVIPSPSDPRPNRITWAQLAERVRENANYYEGLLRDIISGRRWDTRLSAIIISLMILSGFLWTAVRKRTVIEYYISIYMVIYLLWTSIQGERFLVPILPFLFYYFFVPIRLLGTLLHFVSKHFLPNVLFEQRIIAFAGNCCIVFFLFYLVMPYWSMDVNIVRAERQVPYYTGGWQERVELIQWAKEHTPPDSVLMTDKGPYAHLLADRIAYSVPRTNNTQVILDVIVEKGVDYLVAPSDNPYLWPTIQQYAERFTLLYKRGDGGVYVVKE